MRCNNRCHRNDTTSTIITNIFVSALMWAIVLLLCAHDRIMGGREIERKRDESKRKGMK